MSLDLTHTRVNHSIHRRGPTTPIGTKKPGAAGRLCQQDPGYFRFTL